MLNHKNSSNVILMLGLITLAIITRLPNHFLLGHVANFASINAIALFSGASFRKRDALCVTLMSILLSDCVVNYKLFATWSPFYLGWYWQYSSYALIALLGVLLKHRKNPIYLLLTSLSASMLFFVISNLGVWLSTTMYPMTAHGLLTCYIAAMPFFKQTVISDVLFAFMLFYAYPFLKRFLIAAIITCKALMLRFSWR